MSRPGRNRGPVPPRWLYCPRKAADLIIGRFMAFKTPLNDCFNEIVPQECRFEPKMLFEICKSKKIKLGLWIDLTNTSRFYDKKEVENEGCKYIKFQCRGHGEAPTDEQTSTFITIVHNFIAQNPLKSIAIHCTHGFNRTGYLITAYLVEKMDCSLPTALEMFSSVRPPGIYKEDYIKALYEKYDDIEDAPPPPELPDWCFDEDTSGDSAGSSMVNISESEVPETSNSSNSSTSSNGTQIQTQKGRNGQRGIFMEGVPGVYAFTEQPKAFQLQKKVRVMCEWKTKGFPGSHPVSMDNNNIRLLHEKGYRVSWKADGNRYMMLIDGENEIYFFDRDHNIFHVENLRFPHRKDLKRHLKDTLIDGEMVIDKVDGEDIPRYLAYDIVQFEGQLVGKMPFFPTRLHCVENEIIKPRYAAMESGIINKAAEPFSMRHKQFWDLTQAGSLLGEKFASTLSHEPDGLIFQPSTEPYKPGRSEDVLKWKPLNMNSVDFRLRIYMENAPGIVPRKVCSLYVGQLDAPFGYMKYTKALSEYDGKIVECKFENNQWKFMRQRTDKSFPNSFETAQGVFGSIQNPVTKEKLLEYIDKYRYEDETEIMPPPSKKIRR